jgi:hypothetical protein
MVISRHTAREDKLQRFTITERAVLYGAFGDTAGLIGFEHLA